MASYTNTTKGGNHRGTLDRDFTNGNGSVPIGGFTERQRGYLAQCVRDAFSAMDVEGNHLEATTFTITASVTSNSFSLTIS
jgi:hypothetical protein